MFSIFCALFGAIYEMFSHEVYSFYMIYAFAIPLVFGTLFFVLIARSGRKKPSGIALSFWNMAIVTFTVGCIYKGIIEIYGTTNKLSVMYPLAGILLVVIALFTYFLSKEKMGNEGAEAA
ncbi:MAG: hypothetical protein K6A23_07785 [Butyrivibrio sp.]|nr:hypothetical protein [Butyrivibrio sp.]